MKPLTAATANYLKPPRGLDNYDRFDIEADGDLTGFNVKLWRHNASYPENNGPPQYTILNWIRRFPEHRKLASSWNETKYWLPATDMVVERLEACVRENLEFQGDGTEQLYNYVLACGQVADKAANIYAEYKANKSIPDHNYDLHEDFPLTCYQQVALVNSDMSPGYGLFMEQGTGKTPVVISRVCNDSVDYVEETGKMYKGLIVCPRSVRLNWSKEFDKFATEYGKVTILRGDEIERVRLLVEAMQREPDSYYSIVICSYETVHRSWRALGEIMEEMGQTWQLSVLDESHYIKNVKTKRFKYASKLRDISDNRMVLTGTPITNTPLDLYTQLEFIGKGCSGFHSWNAFRRFFGVYRLNDATGHEALVGMQNVPFMQERLARYTFSVKAAEVQKDLPERIYDVLEVSMSTEQRKAYADLRDELAIQIETQLSNSNITKEMLVNNVLVKFLRLSQVTCGYVGFPAKIDEETGEEIEPAYNHEFSSNPKLEVLVELLKEKGPNDKTIVWSNWVPNLLQIQKRLNQEGIGNVLFYGQTSDDERERAVEKFNCDFETKVFIGNPAAGGTGLNLVGYPPEGHPVYVEEDKTPADFPTNCTHVIYFSEDWSPVKRSQSEKRAHRKGTRVPVRVTDLCVPGTIDEQIRSVVVEKQIRALTVSDLREILNNVITGNLDND